MALLILSVVCVIIAINAASIEPICSKFSYEEQLLEKMVRLEFFVENMDKDVTASVTESKREMRDQQLEMSKNLTATIKDFDEKFETLKANVTSVSEATLRGIIEDVQTKVKEFMTNMTVTNGKIIRGIIEDVESHERKIEDFKSSINDSTDDFIKEINEKMKRIEKKFEDAKTNMKDNNLKTLEELVDKKYPVVAFNVYGTVKDYSGSIIPFKNIRLNEGGGFNTDSSKFTAPVTGLYQFNAHVCFEKGGERDYYIQAGTIKIARGEFQVPNVAGDGKCSSFSGVALLQQSETAYVPLSSSHVFVNNDDLNSFSGVLIRAT